jgi:hypothetical protein
MKEKICITIAFAKIAQDQEKHIPTVHCETLTL